MARRSSKQRSNRPLDNRQSRLRIIGGQWRSRLLPIADLPELRPTPNRIRETLFNWLAPTLAGARCLDLFAGTGALGLEALSRGAGQAIFIEQDPQACQGIDAALASLQAQSRALTITGDGCHAHQHIEAGSINLVFIDPPFDKDWHEQALQGVQACLARHAVIYLEYPIERAEAIQSWLASDYMITRQAKAGRVGYCLAQPQQAHHDAS